MGQELFSDGRGVEVRLHNLADGDLLDDGGTAPAHHFHDSHGRQTVRYIDTEIPDDRS